MSASYPHPIIAREGWPFLAATIVVAAASGWLIGWWSAPIWLAVLFVLQFFRDPPRQVPGDAHTVVSPADGRIVAVERARAPYLEREAIKVSVFMNLCYVREGDSLARGQRFGFIRFGSRVDLYIPKSATITAALGDKVYATSTVIATLADHV